MYRAVSLLGSALATLLLSTALRAQEPEPSETPDWYSRASEKSAKREAEQKAQYERNFWAVRAGGGRSRDARLGDAWETRAEGAFVIPLADGAGPLYILIFGLSFWHRNSDAFGATIPTVGFGGGYRTPFVVFYGGLTFAATLDADAEPPGQGAGGFVNAGLDFGPFELLGDARAEYRLYRAGAGRSHLSYGGLLSVDFE